MSAAILSLCTPGEHQRLADMTWPNKVEYASLHGYQFLCKNGGFTMKYASGEKVPFIYDYMLRHPEIEWFWWLDIDTLITNMHVKIEDRIDNNYHFLITEDPLGANAGSFFIRNSPQGKAYMRWMMEVYPQYEALHGFFAEQEVMRDSINMPEWKNIIKVCSQKSFNGYSQYVNYEMSSENIWEKGDFVVHFAGTKMEHKTDILVPLYYTKILKPENTFSFRQRLPLINKLFERTQGQVYSGPFKGMKILPQYEWGDGDAASKLLGIYEGELHETMEKVIAMDPDVILNIGCAEGYYGVGLGLRTNAEVVLVDLNPLGIQISVDTALANDFHKFNATTESNIPLMQRVLGNAQNPFLLMDIEGTEYDMLVPALVPELAKTTILVESHDCFKPGLIHILADRFKETHTIEVIEQKGNSAYTDITRDFSDEQKALIACEFRPETMKWLFMVPKNV